MSNMLIKPMGIGQLIDRSFQLYRKHFVKLMLLMLILFGPLYLLQSLLLSNGQSAGSGSIIEQIQEDATFEEMMLAMSENTNTMDIWQIVLLILVVIPLMIIVIAPIAVSSIVFMVRAFLSGESIPEVGDLLRKSFRRLGPLAGSTVLVGLILFGIYMVTVIIIVAVVVVFGVVIGVMAESGSSPGAGLIVFMVITGIVIFLGIVFLLSYFIIRFFYYLPFVALGEESIGIGRSWRITRKSFWRLFLMYLVISIVLYIFIAVTTLLLTFLTGGGLISQLLQSMVSIVLMPLWIIPYTLSFFDLKARNEATGLEELIQNTIQENGAITAHE